MSQSINDLSTQLSNTINQKVTSYVDALTNHLVGAFTDQVSEEAVRAAVASFAGTIKKTRVTKVTKVTKSAAKDDRVKPKPPTGLVLIYNYKSDADVLIGEPTQTLNDSGFFKKLNKGKKWLYFKYNLAFGPGWLVYDKNRVSEIEDALKAEGVAYEAMERSEYEELIKNAPTEEQTVPKEEKTGEEKK